MLFVVLRIASKNALVGFINKCIRRIRYLYVMSQVMSIGERVSFCSVKYLVGGEYISIGDDCCFGYDLYLTAWHVGDRNPVLKIGNNCSFGSWNHISCSNRVEIGDGLLTGKWVTIVDNSHGSTDYDSMQIQPWSRPVLSKGPILIGKNVWIGDKATVLPGVSIGDGVVIAANSVVTSSIPAYSVAAGNPARVIRTNSCDDK